eukprot:g585.t1
MLIASYVLLVPGLTQVIFSFNIVVNVLGHRIDVQPEKGHVACTETITGLVELLNRTGSRTGAVLIVLYAVVVPILKLLLLALGEAFRYSSARGCVMISRTCILVVQSISKWACPDMFAYILLVHLVRLLDNGSLILTAATLGQCIHPKVIRSSLPRAALLTTRTPWCSPSMLRRVTTVLCVAFVILFGVGLFLPCMALRSVGRLGSMNASFIHPTARCPTPRSPWWSRWRSRSF